MKQELEQQLCSKYPLLFQDKEKPMTESLMCFGCECGDGWHNLIDNLCEQITSHIKSQHDLVDSWDKIEERRKFVPRKSGEIDRPEDAKVKIGQIKFQQIKEKFGGLRAYYSDGDETIHTIVSSFENLSYNICEICGKFDSTVGHTTQGWIQTVCEECSKDPIYVYRGWKKKSS
jgi:hypothetical protein